MKRIAFTGLSLLAMYLLPVLCFSQGTGNFIKTWTATAPETDPNNLMTRPLSDVKLSTMYYDGLGRPQQSVVKQGSLETSSGLNNDLVMPFEYDNVGREIKKYLPYVAGSGDGLFKDNAITSQNSYYAGSSSPIYGQNENTFYALTNFEPSPLNRVIKQMAPGANWAGAPNGGRGISKGYYVNTTTDAVRIWNVTDVANDFGTYTSPGVYAEGELYKNITTDEQGHQVIEFKDKEGKVVLKKVQLTAAADDGSGSNHDGWLCTYYIYDDLNNLRCVIQPDAVQQLAGNSWQLTSALLSEQCFRYEYDTRNRMIRKKVPGAGEVDMVYDISDRLVMTQDANQRASNKWLVILYDNLDRPEETGLLLNTWNNYSFTQHLAAAAASSSYPFTSLTVPSTTYWEELTHTFYDNYNWRSSYGNPLTATYNTVYDSYFQTTSNFPYPQANAQSNELKGLVTGTRIKVIGTSTYLFSINFYDEKGRLIQTQSQNLTGGTDISTTQYSWSGQPLISINKTEKAGSTNYQINVTVSQITYDNLGRVIKIEKKLSNTLVNSGAMSAFNTIVQNEYDNIGQLRDKKLSPAYNNNAGLETENYAYNIRGWLLGMNRDYAKDVNNTNWFGFDLGYDKADNSIVGSQTYSNPQYNGNIEGMVWKSKGDGEKRKYDFTYDAANRLLRGDFTQYTNGSFNQNAGVNFNIKMGDGSNVNTAYDANGNVLQMQQWGLKITGSIQIDNLAYTYQTNSNKLAKVTDAFSDPNTKLGDFYDGTNGATDDYSYDVNGNLTLDNNKAISSITYNYLNLPSVITVTGKGTISYTYDASGNKLQKVTVENNASVPYNGSNYTTNITTTTNYIGSNVYESKSYSNSSLSSMNYTDVLQFIAHEEGRIRALTDINKNVIGFAYNYFLKDHLGNVRMVLTEEQKQDFYPAATLEGDINNSNTAVSYEKSFYTIDATKIVDNNLASGITAYQNNNGISNLYPAGNSGNTNINANSTKLYQLNATSNKTGLGITLKVMAGDKIDIFGKSYYWQNNTGGSGANSAPAILDLLNGLMGSPTGATAGGHTSVTELNGISSVTTPINGFIGDPSRNDPNYLQRPKAFINYILFDDLFRYVSGGFSAVNSTPGLKDHHADLQNISVTKNGYLYIYVSNESPVNVFFDNLQVVHTRGPLLEETHYYPYGLVQAGISSKALNFGGPENKKLFNGKQLENKEFSDGSGLEWYDYGMREYDQQIGRFSRVDPLTEKFYELTPYQFCSNDPVNNIDLDGMEGIPIRWITAAAEEVVKNPNSTTSKVIGAVVGVGTSVQKTITGVGNAIAHPINTLQGIMNLNTPEGMANMAMSVSGKIDAYNKGTGFEKSAIISEAVTDVVTAVVGTKGIAATVKGVDAAVAAGDASELGNTIGTLREASQGSGNFSLGEASAKTSNNIGKIWAGNDATVASDGKTLVSADKLKQYRPPSAKNSPFATTGVQSNFQSRASTSTGFTNNGHLNITPAKPFWHFW